MFRKLMLLGLLVFSLQIHANPRIYITSLDWPPYTGENLVGEGLLSVIAKAAFAEMGYELVINFKPWSRAVALASNPSTIYLGYFPEYFSEQVKQKFIFSNSLGEGPLGFIEKIDKPVPWQELADLKPYSIGTVQGYINTREFDLLVQQNVLKVQPVISDLLNIKKVAAGRIDLAVIDKYVLNHLIKNDKSLSKYSDRVVFNKKLLENKKLYISFKKTERGLKFSNIFNQGLNKIDIKKIVEDYNNLLNK